MLVYVVPELSIHLRYIVYYDDVVTNKFLFTVIVVVDIIFVEDKVRKAGVPPFAYFKLQLDSIQEVEGTNNP